MIDKQLLEKLYLEDKVSMLEISKLLTCSPNKVAYWMGKHGIERRTISEAIYQQHNPHGDPFSIKPVRTQADAILYGMGIGLYWGEGTKSNQYSIRLGNTDPALLNKFMEFLTTLFGVQKKDFHFGLQIFTDTDPEEALAYWVEQLNVKPSQFYKIVVTISGSLGTYRKKSAYGVVTVYYHNKKLRDIIVNLMPR